MIPLVFVCATEKDDEARAALLIHLTPFTRGKVLEVWPGDAAAGSRTEAQRRGALWIAVLSPEWLASAERCADAQKALAEGRLLPVLARSCDWDHPGSPARGLQLLYGTTPINRASDSDAAWTAVARSIAALAQARRSAPGDGTVRGALSAALHLDRSLQWLALQEHLALPEHSLILLCGHRRQRVALFADRVVDHLERERSERPRVVPLGYRDGKHCPELADEWLGCLVDSLGKRLQLAAARPERLLREAAAQQPLFLILGMKPLQQALLSEEAQRGLCEFLGGTLPRILGKAAAANPIRCLVLAEYSAPKGRPLIDALHAALRKARSASLATCPLEEPRTPARKDVEEWLERQARSAEARARVLAAFDALMDEDRDADLSDIARVLDQPDEEEDE